MPLLDRMKTVGANGAGSPATLNSKSPVAVKDQLHSGVTDICGNRHCATGWLQLWRSRRSAIFEESWACSKGCMAALVEGAWRREAAEFEQPNGSHEPRMPLGLVLLAHGWITRAELKSALEAQGSAGEGTVGGWLRKLAGVSGETIARGLAAQWCCTYLPPGLPGLRHAPAALPELLQHAHGIRPVEQSATGTIFMACGDRVEPSVLAAIGRMLRRRVEPAFLSEGEEGGARQRVYGTASTLIHAGEENDVCSRVAGLLEHERPAESRLVRVRDLFWLRMWKGDRHLGSREAGPVIDSFITLPVPGSRLRDL